MSKTEKIMIQDGDTVIELTGKEKETFLADRQIWAEQEVNRKVEAEAREIQRQAILDRLGLTADEAKILLG